MSAVVLEDYFKPAFKKDLSERASAFIMRGTVLVIGVLSVSLVYVVQNLGPILQLSMSVPPTLTGSLFGVFLIGMFLPWIGKKGTFYGAIIASLVLVYIVVRSQLDIAAGLINLDTKITSTEGCTYNFTAVQSLTASSVETEKSFHHISYLYYMPLGATITCISAFILSFFFGFEDPSNVNPKLLAPFIRKYFRPKDIPAKNDIEEIKDI